MRTQILRKSPMYHAVERVAEDRVVKSVLVPEPCLLGSNVLFDDEGKPLVSLLRSHLVKEGLCLPQRSACPDKQGRRSLTAFLPLLPGPRTPLTTTYFFALRAWCAYVA